MQRTVDVTMARRQFGTLLDEVFSFSTLYYSLNYGLGSVSLTLTQRVRSIALESRVSCSSRSLYSPFTPLIRKMFFPIFAEPLNL